MWAQIIKSRAKPGKEAEIRNLPQEFQTQDPDSAMPMTEIFTCTNQNDPSEYYTFVVFESEAKARENEGTSGQMAQVKRMRELYEGEPEFVGLNVEYHRSR